MFWRITRDYVTASINAVCTSSEPLASRVGTGNGDRRAAKLITFKIYDDDGELYYAGICDQEAFDDDESPNGLYACFEWAMYDAGATDLRVNGKSIYG